MNAAKLRQAFRRNEGVVILCALIALNSLGQGSVTPSLPLFAKSFGATVTLIGLVVAMFGIGRLFMSLPGGLLTQLLGRKAVLAGGMALTGIGGLLTAFSSNIGQLLGTQLLSGLGGGLFIVGATIYLRDASSPTTRARYQSLNELSILAGISIGSIVGGFLAESYGPRAPFFMRAALSAFAVPIILAFLPETRRLAEARRDAEMASAAPPTGAPRSGVRALLLNPGFIMVALFSLWIVTTRQGGRFSLMPLLGQDKGFNTTQMGLFFTFTHVPQFFAALTSGYLADRFGRKVPTVPAALLLLAGIAVFIRADTYGELLLAGVLLGLGEGLAGPANVAYFVDVAPRGQEGLVMGLYGTFGGIGSLTGALILGSIADLMTIQWSLWIDGFILVAIALAVFAVAKETGGRRLVRSRASA